MLRPFGVGLGILVLACASRGRLPAMPDETAPAGFAFTPDAPSWTQLAVFLPQADPDAARRWEELVRAALPGVTIREGPPRELAPGVWIGAPSLSDYPVPPEELVRAFGVGLAP